MPNPDLALENYHILTGTHQSEISQSHNTSIRTYEDMQWFVKKLDHTQPKENYYIGISEVIAQEFFRFMLPEHQPQTRLLMSNSGEYYVASSAVKNFKPLQSPVSTMRYFGDILIHALVLNEIDLKPGNVGIVEENGETHAVKIDGDWCFAKLRRLRDMQMLGIQLKDEDMKEVSSSFGITNEDIALLPCLTLSRYECMTNWLDIVVSSKISMTNHKQPSTQSLHDNPQFRRAVHCAMLKWFMLPEDFIQSFINSIDVPSFEGDMKLRDNIRNELRTELTTRIGLLRQAALENDSFKEYLSSSEANDDYTNFDTHLQKYNTAPRALQELKTEFIPITDSRGL